MEVLHYEKLTFCSNLILIIHQVHQDENYHSELQSHVVVSFEATKYPSRELEPMITYFQELLNR